MWYCRFLVSTSRTEPGGNPSQFTNSAEIVILVIRCCRRASGYRRQAAEFTFHNVSRIAREILTTLDFQRNVDSVWDYAAT
jgi:hypothetical protein